MLELLNKTLEKYQITASKQTCEDMICFINKMLEYNKTHNLTSITEPNEIVYKHLLDSLFPLDLLDKSNNIIDIGCGAGFPSLPLAISNRDLNITAIDSVRKKTDFVNIIKQCLNLANLNVIHTRIEEFARNKQYRESFDIVLSRAVAPLNIILEYSAPLLKNGGYILAYKGQNYQEEIDACKNAFQLLDCEIETIYDYKVEELETVRYVLKIKKKSKISDKYPRQQNKPRLNPL